MADSLQRQIVDAIATRAATILTSGVFKTDIGEHVFRWKTKGWEAQEMPGVSIKDPDTPIEIFKLRSSGVNKGGVWQHITRIDFEVAVRLTGDNNSNKDVVDKVRDAIDDVYTMIGIDQKWGGLALWTIPVDHTIAVDQEEKTFGGAKISVDVVYRTLAFDTDTQG